MAFTAQQNLDAAIIRAWAMKYHPKNAGSVVRAISEDLGEHPGTASIPNADFNQAAFSSYGQSKEAFEAFLRKLGTSLQVR